MESNRKWLAAIFLALLLLPVAFAAAIIYLQIRQDDLNHGLIRAVNGLDSSVTVSLLDQGADANIRDVDSPKVTFWQVIERMLHGQSAPRPSSGPTLLMLAVRRGDARIVRALLAHKATGVNGTTRLLNGDEFDKSPLLLLAARQNNMPVAEALLDYGADINSRDASGSTAVMEFLCQMPASDAKQSVFQREQKRCLENVKRLVERGAHTGEAELSYAHSVHADDLVNYLLERGGKGNTGLNSRH